MVRVPPASQGRVAVWEHRPAARKARRERYSITGRKLMPMVAYT
jgi:hypothetical protein